MTLATIGAFIFGCGVSWVISFYLGVWQLDKHIERLDVYMQKEDVMYDYMDATARAEVPVQFSHQLIVTDEDEFIVFVN